MLAVISPAKTLDYESPLSTELYTQPRFLETSEALVEHMRDYSAAEIATLMQVSDKIAQLNVGRFQDWNHPFTPENARPAAFAFKGDVYEGLQAATLDPAQLDYLQQHLRILSGLYGCLRPLDLMQPYRLEMGKKVGVNGAKNLYEVWKEQVTATLNAELAEQNSENLINLASNEYFKAVDKKTLNATIITPEFRDFKNGQYKMISFYAKRARGMMSRYMAVNNTQNADDLKAFDSGSYLFDESMSTETKWVFTRDPATL